MDECATPPYARVWQLSGGDVDDPSFARAYCDDVVPMLEELTGYLGVFVLVDSERHLLRAISFWQSDETRERSRVVFTRVVDALTRLASATFDGAWDYEVVVSDFWGVLGARSQRGEVDHLLVRVGVLQGPAVADPAVIEPLRDYLVTTLAPDPGCVGTLLLRDPVRPAAFGASFWVDADAAARTRDLGGETLRQVTRSTGTTSSNVGVFEVLVNRPMTRSVR